MQDYLEQGEQDRQDLVSNLTTKGITGLSGDETFTELVPQVLNIPSGGSPNLQSKSLTISSNTVTNISADSGYDGLSGVEVTTFITPNLQNKSQTISTNTTTTIQADSGYDGLDTVTVTTNVGIDWTQIGYASEPSFIENGFDYAKTIYNNWTPKADCENEFYYDYDLVFAPLINTSITTNLKGFFSECRSLIYVPQLNTSSATSTRGMFYNCFSLSQGNFTKFNTANVETMQSMFNACWALVKVKLEYNTSSVQTMEAMFQNCRGLTELDISSFTSDSLTSTKSMFYNCEKLLKIDMRGMTLSNSITTYTTMFGSSASSGPANDCLIIVKDSSSKTWLKGKFSRLTNIQTAEEYEASLNS